jgi:hypothetical protein
MAPNVKVNVKPASVQAIFIGLAILITVNILSRYNVIDLTLFQANIITIIGAIFLLTEVSILTMLKKRSGGVLDIVISIVAILALIGSISGIAGFSIALLLPIQGIVDIGLLVLILIEIFRKN